MTLWLMMMHHHTKCGYRKVQQFIRHLADKTPDTPTGTGVNVHVYASPPHPHFVKGGIKAMDVGYIVFMC